MINRKKNARSSTPDRVSPTLKAWGLRSWYFVGIALAAMVIVTFFGAIVSLFVPFVIAVVISMIFHPLVDVLEKYRVNRIFGSILVMLLIIGVVIFTGWLMWAGVFKYSDMIMAQLEAGLTALNNLITRALPDEVAKRIVQNAMVAAPQMLGGISAVFFSSVSSLIAFFMGIYFSFFLLYYLLNDWHDLSDWVGRHLGVPETLGIAIVGDSTNAVRKYFYALTLANLPVAIVVGLVMWLLDLPLALPVAIVTLLTCYIPFLGAIVSAIFACLVALGSGGLWEAIVIVVVILAMQNIVAPILVNKKASDELKLNPIVTLSAIIVGAILFGALGAVLGSPVAAVLIGMNAKIKGFDSNEPPNYESDDLQNNNDPQVDGNVS